VQAFDARVLGRTVVEHGPYFADAYNAPPSHAHLRRGPQVRLQRNLAKRVGAVDLAHRHGQGLDPALA
jgi:hypothetical protein